MMKEVVHVTYPQPEIAVITMEDRESRNIFTPSVQAGIEKAFISIEANPNVKVVITQGYDNYYARGGDLEGLLLLATGKVSFADAEFFRMPLKCKLPTIAAVHGHALGGGLAFACMHDFVFLASGVQYSASFMQYGFTPGMGTTYTIPKHFGLNCGTQMLFSANQFGAKELEDLNCLLPFYPKKEVFEHAMQLARDISDKTLTSILLLKEQLSFEMRQILPSIIEKEVAMHAKTITSEEAITRIKKIFQ